MNERIKQLMNEAVGFRLDPDSKQYEAQVSPEDLEVFAEMIIQECADFVRETYDHETAESIAWSMEIKYELHGDYA